MSGTVRMVPVTLVPVCQVGLANWVETPPPAVLQALSELYVVPDTLRLVPPTPVLYGLEAGKSTAFTVEPEVERVQSREPSSPDAEKIEMPWAAACLKELFTAVIEEAVVSGSQEPQEMEMTETRLSETILAAMSISPWSLLGAS